MSNNLYWIQGTQKSRSGLISLKLELQGEANSLQPDVSASHTLEKELVVRSLGWAVYDS